MQIHASLFVLLNLLFIPVQAGPVTTDSTTGTIRDLKFVTIPAGQFLMETTDLNKAIAELPNPEVGLIDDETPAHMVVFEHAFRLSQTEVTQAIWLNVMGTKPGPKFHWQAQNWQQLPVVSVSWDDTKKFIFKLNQQSRDTLYRLPTEAEWEYAARAGSTSLRPFSVLAMDEYAWYIHNSNDEIQPVAQLKPNAWGLHDMYGNAWEWVADWYNPTAYTNSAKIDPQGPVQGSKKVRRGGSFHCPPHMIRSAYRAANYPDDTYSVLGIRLIAEKK